MKACPMCNGPASLVCVGGLVTIRCAVSCDGATEVQATSNLEAVRLWNDKADDIEWDRLAYAEISRDQAARDREHDRQEEAGLDRWRGLE